MSVVKMHTGDLSGSLVFSLLGTDSMSVEVRRSDWWRVVALSEASGLRSCIAMSVALLLSDVRGRMYFSLM
jgi:hypothetical protein